MPCSLELGGKSPFIVLEDADLDNAAATAALMYRNAGQVCLAGTRLLVHQKVADKFVDIMRGYVENLNIGDPRDSATEVGPIIHPRQFDRVSEFVDRAVAAGAEVLWGAAKHDFGAQYYKPTLLTGVGQQDEIVQNEVFGPVLTLQTFVNDDEVIELANGTATASAAYVTTKLTTPPPSPIASEPGSSGLTVSVFAIWKRRLVGLNVRESAAKVATGASSSLATLRMSIGKTPFRASFSQR